MTSLAYAHSSDITSDAMKPQGIYDIIIMCNSERFQKNVKDHLGISIESV